MIGTITLNPSIDQHISVKNLVKDDANRALTITLTPGGKGINVSKVVRELGGVTRAYALVGGFTGEYLKELVKPLDFSLTTVPVHGNTRVNTVVTDLKDETQTRISAPGPTVRRDELGRFTRLLLSVRPRPFLWALGGSLSKGMSPGTYRRLIRVLQKNGTRCILDTDNEALKQGVEAKPFMIKPNEYEMQRLCGKSVRSVQEYLLAARRLVRQGVQVVIVSLGAKGALFVTSEEAFHSVAPAVEVRSKVGAGDSLIGGVAWGLHRKMSLRDAAKLGVAASSSAVMRGAPRLCLKSDLKNLVERVEIRQM